MASRESSSSTLPTIKTKIWGERKGYSRICWGYQSEERERPTNLLVCLFSEEHVREQDSLKLWLFCQLLRAYCFLIERFIECHETTVILTHVSRHNIVVAVQKRRRKSKPCVNKFFLSLIKQWLLNIYCSITWVNHVLISCIN